MLVYKYPDGQRYLYKINRTVSVYHAVRVFIYGICRDCSESRCCNHHHIRLWQHTRFYNETEVFRIGQCMVVGKQSQHSYQYFPEERLGNVQALPSHICQQRSRNTARACVQSCRYCTQEGQAQKYYTCAPDGVSRFICNATKAA